MSEGDQLTIVARNEADQTMDKALGELKVAARQIGEKHGIPDDIAGHSVEELLGRMAYVPSMSRELRTACGQELARLALVVLLRNSTNKAAPKINKPPAPATKPAPIIPKDIPGNVPTGLDVGELDGVTPNAVKALREAGLNKVGDVLKVPDDHLVKLNGLGEKSVAQIRIAIAKASAA